MGIFSSYELSHCTGGYNLGSLKVSSLTQFCGVLVNYGELSMSIQMLLVFIAFMSFYCNEIDGIIERAPKIRKYDCNKPDKSTLEGTVGTNRHSLIATAFPKETHHRYKVLDYNTVCLAQGRKNNMYSSASVIVAYEVEGYQFEWDYRKQRITKQFDLYCSNGEWKVIKRHLGTVFSNTKLLATMKTSTRYDCQTSVCTLKCGLLLL